MSGIQGFIDDVTRKPANIIVPMALFFLLTPDNLLSVPGAVNLVDFPSSGPNRTVVLTHLAIFGAVLATLRYNFPEVY